MEKTEGQMTTKEILKAYGKAPAPGAPHPGSVATVDPGFSGSVPPDAVLAENDYAKKCANVAMRADAMQRTYPTPSGSAYPSESILTSKVSGWIGVFGDHYLCQLGCKRYASKRLDDVIKFFEREVRLWYKAKELAKKGKLDVEVKGHVRKSRKKKLIDTSKHSEIMDGELDETGQWRKKGDYMYPVKEEKMDEVEKGKYLIPDRDLTKEQLKRRKARYEKGICDDVMDEKEKE